MSPRLAFYLPLSLLLAAGVALRAWDWPHRHELRHGDEMAYCWNSLQLLEGTIPGYHYAPAAPQTWVGWAYAGGLSAYHFFFPSPEERAASFETRPFVAVNHALWDSYNDLGILRYVWIAAAIPFQFWSIIAAYRIGHRKAGLPGAIFLGGFIAIMPIFVDLSVQARPYVLSWSFAIIALDFAMLPTDRALRYCAIFTGLAISTRVDMLMILPIIWSEIWSRRSTGDFRKRIIRFHAITVITALLLSPWFLTNLIGELRTIATIRLAVPTGESVPFSQTLKELLWHQAFAIPILLALWAAFQKPADGPRRWLRALYVLFITASIFKATTFGLQHQGAPMVIVLFMCVAPFAEIFSKDKRIAWAAVALALILPLIQCVLMVIGQHRHYFDDESVAWVEQHVPAGTLVYCFHTLRDPLPTTQASDSLWAAVNDHDAWKKKFSMGLAHFHLTSDEFPRALSDENMALERGNYRGVFILGSRTQVPRPRYDVHFVWASTVFGTLDLPTDFAKSGGIVVWYGLPDDPNVKDMGKPIAQWISPAGNGVFIYASADARAKLNLATD
ncbi:MAG TPA: hypothetical protein VHS31_01135 [Tepidisphaeraceae bacterium]|jgi:hypothetical protein|nr:hypothetical protein [Tepidisphaeraceae bacterium]